MCATQGETMTAFAGIPAGRTLGCGGSFIGGIAAGASAEATAPETKNAKAASRTRRIIVLLLCGAPSTMSAGPLRLSPRPRLQARSRVEAVEPLEPQLPME